MPRFIEHSIDIAATRSTVWTVLTSAQHSRVWGSAFSPGWWIDTDGLIQSEVAWKDTSDKVFVRGRVVGSVPYQLLKFAYFDDPDDNDAQLSPDSSFERFVLTDSQGDTLLTFRAGPYDGDRQKDFAAESVVWEKALQKIKQVAEQL